MSDDLPPHRGVPNPLQGGPVGFGPYWLDARLAVGGTAEVYLARPRDVQAPGPERLVVKRLLPHFVQDPEGRTMFDREARLHKAVKHKNVVTVFGSGVAEDGEPYLAMEFIDGVDLYRLLRRLSQEGQALPLNVAMWVATEVLDGLASVHGATDAKGNLIGIIHRDVTPSNVYLSLLGDVKLGDFGIARASRLSFRNVGSAMLKGKFAYLAPEQVAAEPFDHRADLFSAGAVIVEMLVGKPMFSGSGQLAVLLAIRDCKLDVLHAAEHLPHALHAVLARALSKNPAGRFESAERFGSALRAFCPRPDVARSELAALVRWVQSKPSTDSFAVVRESIRSLRQATPSKPKEPPDDFERTTGEYDMTPSYATLHDGRTIGPLTYAKLIEALATGGIVRGDKVDYQGRGLSSVENVEDLSRFLPPDSVTSLMVPGIGTPDFQEAMGTGALLTIFARIATTQAAGVLFAERRDHTSRKELYFQNGHLHHVASSDASELLGEYLLRKGVLSREELSLALAVLPRYGGRMGDTLIALGLVNAFDVFRAIREQGRDKVLDLFRWTEGRLTLYVGETSAQVDFPLELELGPLMMAGLTAALPEATLLIDGAARGSDVIRPLPARRQLEAVVWPMLVAKVIDLTAVPRTLGEVIHLATSSTTASAADAMRAVRILIAAGYIEQRPPERS
jgi:serine/threonine-protein kinase